MPLINRYEKKFYSQNGEDGILDYIFNEIGSSESLIEIGFDIPECNSYYWFFEKRWNGIIIDGNEYVVENAKVYFTKYFTDWENYIKMIYSFVTKENINQTLKDINSPKNIDFLSIDIDGNDYWIWKTIDNDFIHPRVVVIEYNSSMGIEEAVTIPYDPYFSWDYKKNRCYHGVSLPALIKLGKEKGYTFIGCESNGVNAFFIRNDIIKDSVFQKVDVENGWYPNRMYRRNKPDFRLLERV